MKFTEILSIIILIFISFKINKINSDVVCDLELYILELKQDLGDNGMLDCLRKIEPPNGVIETLDQKNKRISAQWDTACSFESTYDWLSTFKKIFGITTLVDEIGEPVSKNLEGHADMCEIFRAVIASGLLSHVTSDVTNIPIEALNYIDCPGISSSSRICAANGISFHKNDMWTIFMDSSYIQINNKPQFNRIKKPLQDETQDPGISIDRSQIELVNRLKSVSDNELNKMISSSKDFTKVENKPPQNPWNRVSFVNSATVKETQYSNTGWKFWKSGSVSLKTNNDVYIIGFSMVTGYAMNSRLALRLVLDDVTQISTRMIQGYLDFPSITTAFISHLQTGTHNIETQYRASANLQFEDTETSNLTTGVVVIPANNLFLKKIINPKEFQLYNDNNWADFPNLSTQVKFTSTSYCLILYNISMPGMQSHIITRIDINTKSVLVI